MALFTRRQALGSTAGLVCGIAGCSTSSGSDPVTPTVTESDLAYSNCAADLDTIQIRNTEGKLPIRSTTHSGGEKLTNTAGYSDVWYVSNPTQRQALTYETASDDIQEVKDFIDNTDLSSHTVAIYQFHFDSCATVDVEFAKWEEIDRGEHEGYSIAIKARHSSRDGECDSVPSEHIEATVIRIPADINEIYHSSVGEPVDRPDNC